MKVYIFLIVLITFFIVTVLSDYVIYREDSMWDEELLKELFPRTTKKYVKIIYIVMILITGTVVYLNELMKVPVFFIFTMIATWLAVIFLMWNHKNTQKKQKRMFMVGGIFLSVVWIALYMMQIID